MFISGLDRPRRKRQMHLSLCLESAGMQAVFQGRLSQAPCPNMYAGMK